MNKREEKSKTKRAKTTTSTMYDCCWYDSSCCDLCCGDVCCQASQMVSRDQRYSMRNLLINKNLCFYYWLKQRIRKDWALRVASTTERVILILGRERIGQEKSTIAFSEIKAGLCLFCLFRLKLSNSNHQTSDAINIEGQVGESTKYSYQPAPKNLRREIPLSSS